MILNNQDFTMKSENEDRNAIRSKNGESIFSQPLEIVTNVEMIGSTERNQTPPYDKKCDFCDKIFQKTSQLEFHIIQNHLAKKHKMSIENTNETIGKNNRKRIQTANSNKQALKNTATGVNLIMQNIYSDGCKMKNNSD